MRLTRVRWMASEMVETVLKLLEGKDKPLEKYYYRQWPHVSQQAIMKNWTELIEVCREVDSVVKTLHDQKIITDGQFKIIEEDTKETSKWKSLFCFIKNKHEWKTLISVMGEYDTNEQAIQRFKEVLEVAKPEEPEKPIEYKY